MPQRIANRKGDVVVVFDEPPPLGITWKVNEEEGEMEIEKIRPGTAAADKPELELGLMLTHINEDNVEDVDQKWPDMPLTDAMKQVTNMLRDAARPVTLTLKHPLAQLPEAEPEPDEEEPAELDEEPLPQPADDGEPLVPRQVTDIPWVSGLSGKWKAEGEDEHGPGQDELILLEVSAEGAVSGAVDDGDGVFDGDEGDCRIENGRVDPRTRRVSFDQVYSDGAVTRWEARYDEESDTLVDGKWSGECDGTFVASRAEEVAEPRRTEGYSVATPTPVTVYTAPSLKSESLGQLGPGTRAVSDDSWTDPGTDPGAEKGAVWVQLSVKYSVEDEGRGSKKGKVQKGWVPISNKGVEQLSRLPDIDGSGDDATMLPTKSPSARQQRARQPSPNAAEPRATRRTPTAPSPAPAPAPAPDPNPQPSPQPSPEALKSVFAGLGGESIADGDDKALMEAFETEMNALNMQCEMVTGVLARWATTLECAPTPPTINPRAHSSTERNRVLVGVCRRTRRDSAALGMPPFAEKFEEQTSILEIQRYIDDLRQVVDPSWKPSGDASAEGAASLAIEPESPKQRLQRQLSRGKDGLSRVKDSAKKKAEVRTLPTSSDPDSCAIK